MMSKFTDECVASALSYLDRDSEFVPPYGNDDDVIRLDAFIFFLRRRKRCAALGIRLAANETD